MAEKEKTRFDKYIFPIILVIVTAVATLLVEKYVLRKAPELSYQIAESPPIHTGVKEYYTTAFYISNTGNVPLKNVVLNAAFGDTIATIRVHPQLTKNGKIIASTRPESDSLTLKLNFDLAAEEQCSVTVVSAGRLRPESFKLKSD